MTSASDNVSCLGKTPAVRTMGQDVLHPETWVRFANPANPGELGTKTK